jgi:anti-anti-sigma factor
METEVSMTCRTNDDGAHVVTLAGEVDVDTVIAFRDFLFALRGDVDLDCGGLTFIDSGGLGTLVMYCRELDDTGGHLRLTDVSDDCWKVLEVAGLTHLLDACRV